MVGQLNLFKGRKQRGTALPPISEFALQCVISDTLKLSLMPGWRYTHLPLGELRDKITAARLKRMGVTRGWPDLMFFHASGQVCFLELKRRGGKPTEEQEAMGAFLRGAGHGYLCTDDDRKAIDQLKQWGVVRAGVEVR